MKRYTGNLVIELEDQNTGNVETVSETNMVTNAVNDILGVNPMGVMYKAGGEYDDSLTWNNALLPICPNMIGGILLFPGSITEQADNIYLPSTNLPVAYASNDVNATANTKRGSMNLTESTKLTDGYKFVWEFTPSQGNGTITAVGLTSKQGGANAYGSEVAVDTTLLQIKKVSLDDGDGFINDLFRTVTVDFENAKLYSLGYASNTVTIKRYRIPVFDIGLNEKLDDSTLVLEDTTVLQCSTFHFYGSYTPYGIFMDGGDGYWYGFANQGNSSGNATVLWIKIRKSDYTFTEGQWTLSNATLMTMGSFKEGSSYPSGNRSAVVRNGYLYVPSYDKTGVYKINISKGAYKILDNAKKCADQNPGYKVFDADGNVVYEPKEAEPAVKVPFLVKVSISDLNIRKGPGTGYDRIQFCRPGVYTIVEVKSGKGASAWGKLKSGIGWVSLEFCKKL